MGVESELRLVSCGKREEKIYEGSASRRGPGEGLRTTNDAVSDF